MLTCQPFESIPVELLIRHPLHNLPSTRVLGIDLPLRSLHAASLHEMASRQDCIFFSFFLLQFLSSKEDKLGRVYSMSFGLSIFPVFLFLIFLFLDAALTHPFNTLLHVFICGIELTLLRKWGGGVWGGSLEIWTV